MAELPKERQEANLTSDFGHEQAPKTVEEIIDYINDRRVDAHKKALVEQLVGENFDGAVDMPSETGQSSVASKATGIIDAKSEISELLADVSDQDRKMILEQLVQDTAMTASELYASSDALKEIKAKFRKEYEALDEEEKQKVFDQYVGDLAEPFSDLSERSIRDVLDYIEMIKDVRAFDQMEELTKEYAARHRELFEDKRFMFETADGRSEHMMKDVFGKLRTMEWLKEFFQDGQMDASDLRKVARLSFDANGLKAVNDLSGSHDKGDEYLKKVAAVFRNKDSRARQMLEEMGVAEENYLPLLGGGDEYSVLVRSDKELDQRELNEVVEKFEKEIEAIEGIENLIDLQNDFEVRLRFMGLTRSEFDAMDESQRAEVLKQADETIPEDFKMWASAAGGVATLEEGMATALNDSRSEKRLTGDESEENSMLAKIMGGLWDASDEWAEFNKGRYKEDLKNGTELEQFYSKVMKRTEEARQLEKHEKMLADELAKIEEVKRNIRDELLNRDDLTPQLLIQQIYARLEALGMERKSMLQERMTASEEGQGESDETGSLTEQTLRKERADFSTVQMKEVISKVSDRAEKTGLDLSRADTNSELEERLARLPEKHRQEAVKRLGNVVEHVDALINGRQLEFVELMDSIEGEPNQEQVQKIMQLEAELDDLFTKRDSFIERELQIFDLAYADSRFTFEAEDGQEELMMKDAYGKLKTIDWVKEMYEQGQVSPEEMDKVARFSFDANGLKAVNDLSGSHAKGDEYLKRLAEVFRDPNTEAATLLREMGATEVLPLLGGGDEYSIMVKSDRPLEAESLENVLNAYRNEIAKLDVSDLVDFSDPEVAKRAGLDDVSDDFKMRASASAAVATLGEGMRQAIIDRRERKRLTGNENYAEQMYAKIVGGLWDISDKRADDDKKEFKRQLASSAKSEDSVYSKVLKRTEEARNLERSINELNEKLGRQDRLLRDLAVGVGGIGVDAKHADQETDMSVLALDSLKRLVSNLIEEGSE